MRAVAQRGVLVLAAIAEILVLVLTPRIIVVNGQRPTASSAGASDFGPALDLQSIAAYSGGIVVIAALLWKALEPPRG